MTDFFDKIAGGIDKSIKAVSSKGKELIGTSKLKNEIRDVQNLIQNKFQALGKKVFEMLNKGALNEEDIKSDCGEITLLYKKITELEEAIKKVEAEALKQKYGAGIIMCAKCGSPNEGGNKFCIGCGAPMTSEPVPKGNICPTCGASLKADAKFCMRCGRKTS